MSTARRLEDPALSSPAATVGRDRRALRRVVEDHVSDVRDRLEQIAALIQCGELDDAQGGESPRHPQRFERLREALECSLPELERFLAGREER